MRQALDYLWPRANSNVYAEAKRLVSSGLVEARVEWTGERRRTVYSITDAGRLAVAEWLARSSSRPRFESEALMKVFFAENGTRETLLDAIRELGASARTGLEHFQRIADLYEDGEGEFPERFHLSALIRTIEGADPPTHGRASSTRGRRRPRGRPSPLRAPLSRRRAALRRRRRPRSGR